MSKKIKVVKNDRCYCFCGNGQGIPGLPHEVTAAQAKELGLLDVLRAAIQNGNYRQVRPIPAGPAEKGE